MRARAVPLPVVSRLPPTWGGTASALGAPRTDFADGGGSSMQIRSRGRWDSDMELVYARDTVAQQLAAADAMAGASSVSLEELCPGWSQPARGEAK